MKFRKYFSKEIEVNKVYCLFKFKSLKFFGKKTENANFQIQRGDCTFEKSEFETETERKNLRPLGHGKIKDSPSLYPILFMLTSCSWQIKQTQTISSSSSSFILLLTNLRRCSGQIVNLIEQRVNVFILLPWKHNL